MDRTLSVGRRAVATFALGGATLPGVTLAQTAAAPPRQRGPEVWMGMDQAELDAAYDQSVYAPNIRQVLDRYRINSATAREILGPPQRVAYGSEAIEQLDIYRAPRPEAPVMIFVHGGAWRAGLARDYGFPAELFVRAGAHLVVPDFSWVQDRGGDLMPVADQVQRAIAWVARHAASFGGDPGRIFLSGHSSGAHLSAVALTTPAWRRAPDLPADVVKGALLCSGPYDLRPVRLSARSRYVRLTDESEAALSPQRHAALLNTPLILAYGSLETPEYQRHARDFAAVLAAAGKAVRLIRAEAYNHFEVMETMANPYGLLGRAVLELMGLRTPA